MKQDWHWIVAQIVLAVATMLMFFTTVSWLGKHELSELPPDYRSPVPTSAKSFSNDHGHVVFHSDGTISQEPVAFGVRAVGTTLLFGAFLASIWWQRSRSARLDGAAQ